MKITQFHAKTVTAFLVFLNWIYLLNLSNKWMVSHKQIVQSLYRFIICSQILKIKNLNIYIFCINLRNRLFWYKPIILKNASYDIAHLIRKNCFPMLKIFYPFPFILWAIWIIKCSISLSLSVEPLPLISD